MKKKLIITIIIIIFVFITLNFQKFKQYIFNDIIIFDLLSQNERDKEYIINYQKEKIVQINVFQTMKNDAYKKIAPGSYGKFTIKTTKIIEKKDEIILKEITNKPQNLIFIINKKRFNTLKEMQEIVNEQLIKTGKVVINWEWNYDINKEEDIEDTEDGENPQQYIFEIEAIVEEKI